MLRKKIINIYFLKYLDNFIQENIPMKDTYIQGKYTYIQKIILIK